MRTFELKTVSGNIEMSKIVLGTCYYGTEISKDVSFALMDEYYERGGRTLDTARVYAEWLENGLSASERTVGEWMASRGVRKEITLVTKGGHPDTGSRISEKCIKHDIQQSMKYLGGSVDVYFLHRDDVNVPVSEIMDILDELVKQGKTRAIGASNWSLKRILEANAYAEKNGKTPFSVSQIQWSLAACTSESWGDETLVCMGEAEYDAYLKSGIPVMAFSPQAKGFFSKYLAGGRETLNEKIDTRFVNETNLKRAERVEAFCEETGVSPAAAALSYIICNRLNAAAIVGCSNVSQLEDSMNAANLDFDPQMVSELARP